jgi:hypothetical protein
MPTTYRRPAELRPHKSTLSQPLPRPTTQADLDAARQALAEAEAAVEAVNKSGPLMPMVEALGRADRCRETVRLLEKHLESEDDEKENDND